MANKLYEETSIQAIANAIRTKNGSTDTYTVSEMADAITSLSTDSGTTPTGTISITENGTHDVTNYASANVNVPTGSAPSYQQKTVTENGIYTADTGYDALSQVIVNVASSGGGSGLPDNIKAGSFTFEADSSDTKTVTHGGTTAPIAIFVLVDDVDTVNVPSTVGGVFADTMQGGLSCNASGTVSFSSGYVCISNVTAASFDFAPRSATYPFKTGLTYRFFAWY